MKRVLIVSYFFPPISNMGSHRILRFVRHLREFGWEPVVLTGPLTSLSQTDERLLQKVPADITVHRVGGMDLTELWRRFSGHKPATAGQTTPLKTQGLTTFLNRWVMVPDKQFPWIQPAAKAGVRSVKDLRIAAIYSTSDPLSDHLVARRIARRTRVPWLAEFRDLWLGSPYFARSQPTALHRALHVRLEHRAVTDASRVLCLSRGIQDYFVRTYPQTPSCTVYNSFDPAEYEPEPAPVPADQFTVLYAGALYSSRSPEPFLAGFARFVKQHGPARFVIVGGSPDLDLPAMIARHGLGEHVELVGRVSHAEALRRMQAATVLLAVQSPEDTIHVPGKLFEYVGARRPILVMARSCEMAEMIRNHKLGWVAAPDGAAVAGALDEAYAAWQARGHDGLALQAADQFSIHETTRQLAEQLDTISRQP